MTSISCRNDSNIAIRFFDHLKLGVSRDIQPHQKNLLEKAGDTGMWPWENLPKRALDCIRDPRVVTVALTSLALYVNSFGHYSEETKVWTAAAIALLPTIPVWAPRFFSWVAGSSLIASVGARAEGRYCNKDLMNEFYGHPHGENSQSEARAGSY